MNRIDKIKRILVYFAVFAAALFILAAALVLSWLIPQSMMHENMLSSAEYLCKNQVFFDLKEGAPYTRIDRYADSILLSIAYNTDSVRPIRAAMRCDYYYTPYQNENDNLLDFVRDGKIPEQQYLRYWHGSAIAVRIMHLFTDIHGMYMINAVLLCLLTVLMLIYLIYRRLCAAAVGITAGLLAAGIIYVPYSLEYTWMFLLMPVFTAAAVHCAVTGKGDIAAMFLVFGMITNFVDFLTTETITLTIPLMCAVYAAHKNGGKIRWLQSCAAWVCGYTGMWISKWLIASAVLGENVMPYVTSHITRRTGDASPVYATSAVLRNISCMFPLAYGGGGVVMLLIILTAAAYVCFVYRREKIARSVLIYPAAAVIPLLRYIVLREHAYLHYFFTYRALAAAVTALCLIIADMTDPALIFHKKRI